MGETKSKQKKKDVFRANYDTIIDEVCKHDCENLLNSTFQEDYKTFFQILNEAMDKHTPMKKPPKKKKNLYLNSKAWRVNNRKVRL